MRISSGVLLLLVGCGSVHEKPDAAVSDGPLPDVSDAAPATWSAPVKLTTLSGAGSEWGPTLRGDLLELYFASDRAGGSFDDIYVSTRPTATSAWGTPTLVVELSSAVSDLQPSLSADGLTIYIARFVSAANGFDIFKAVRPSLTSAWGTPAVASDLSSAGDDAPMNLSSSQLSMLLSSNRGAGAGGYDLYVATRGTAAQPFGAATAITSANTSSNEFDGHLMDDGLTLYLSSDSNSATAVDLYVTTRSSASSPFGPLVPLTTVNSGANDEDPWVSADQHLMVFSSLRDGTRDLWMSTR